MASRHNIFIYGTLRDGGRAHHLMAGAEWVSAGTIKGKLVHVDQYPGLIISEKGRVSGDLYRVNDELLLELDRYEGCFDSPPHYTRESVEVLLDDGRLSQTSVYVFQLLDSLSRPLEWIDSGDWIAWWETNKKA